MLVASGIWTDAGAREIVATFNELRELQPEQTGWPGPIPDAPPLFV
jgi:hypothetical protein